MSRVWLAALLVACSGGTTAVQAARAPACVVAEIGGARPHVSSTTGGFFGVAVDDHGCALTGIKLSAWPRPLKDAYVATSSSSGAYAFGDLPPGDYVVTTPDDVVVARGSAFVGLASRLDAAHPAAGSGERFTGWHDEACGGVIEPPN